MPLNDWETARNQARLRADARTAHAQRYNDTLRNQLNAARRGWLSPTWRDNLIRSTLTNPPRSGPRPNPDTTCHQPLTQTQARQPQPPTPPHPASLDVGAAAHKCLMNQRDTDHDTDPPTGTNYIPIWACADLDVANISPAAWEPYATNGDWRTALDAWYTASIDAFEDYALRFNHHTKPDEFDTNNDLLIKKGIDLQAWRDELEASYRAGIAAGTHITSEWTNWFADRIKQRRNPQQPPHYRLLLTQDSPQLTPPNRRPTQQHTDPHQLTRRYRDLLEYLPTHWTHTQPTPPKHVPQHSNNHATKPE